MSVALAHQGHVTWAHVAVRRVGPGLARWVLLGLAVAACAEPPLEHGRNGKGGGRVLVAPGAGLAGARVVVDQVNLYDDKAEIRKHVGETVTDEQGYFEAVPTGTINGLLLFDASGGTFVDPISRARVQLDASVHLKALHWLGLFEDRSDGLYITPVHALVEARFRFKVAQLGDTTQAVNDAYKHIGSHFGGLDWEKTIPADLARPAASPTDEVRAAFVLGGLAILADDIRTASNSTPQVVNLMMLLDAAERDLGDQWLDGNDANASTPGSGLQVGDCPPVDAGCVVPATGCQLGACRAMCDIYANTYRNLLSASISKFIGPKMSPSPWNQTTLGSEDARTLTTSMSSDVDMDLFGNACAETQNRAPPTITWDVAPLDGALVGGAIALRVHAIDNDANKLPTVSFQGYSDTDGDPTNDVATTIVNTRAATSGIDGPLTVTAVASDRAGNLTTSMRTFVIDNTPPQVTLDSGGGGLYVDSANVWWTATPGPTLHGAVTDAHPGTVQVKIGGVVVATAMVNGTQWSAQLPPNALSTSSNDVTIEATDQAGNTATTVQALRLDTTPPSLMVDPSPVFDESNSTFTFVDDASGSFALHVPHGAPVDLSGTGACPTIHKYAHLLFAPNADGTHAILGSSGPLNPLTVNVVAADDGVGIQPGSVQYRVLFNHGTSLDELLPWTPIPPAGSHFTASLYVNGVHPIPQLGTTNGEYHIQLRAIDQFGRTASQERCWNHQILAPPLNPTSTNSAGMPSPGGEQASGFAQALFSTELNPGSGQTGNVSTKLLNTNAAGAALWRARFKNYLGLPVYVTVQISQGINATVSRQFRIMNSLTAFRGAPASFRCGNSHCVSNPAPTSTVEYDSGLISSTQAGLELRARLFQMAGNEMGMEFMPITSNDAAQTYVFAIPARTAPQGSSLPEYAVLTHLLSTRPAGNGTDVTMAPADASHPDTDASPYGEFTFGPANSGVVLTGKLMGPIDGEQICMDEDFDPAFGGFFCIRVASRQEYRALVQLDCSLGSPLITLYSFAATPALPFGGQIPGQLNAFPGWSTSELALP